MSINLRKLKKEEIRVRVLTINDWYVNIVLYIDPRTVIDVLDESVGNTNWKKTTNANGDVANTTISIWDSEKNQWIAKNDYGSGTSAENTKSTANSLEKAASTDSFKRAAVLWGIGKELHPKMNMSIKKTVLGLNKEDKKFYKNLYIENLKYDENNNDIAAMSIKCEGIENPVAVFDFKNGKNLI